MASAVVPTEISSGTPSHEPTATPAVMPAHRAEAFRHAIAARVRTGATIATLLREQQALAGALADADFRVMMAAAFTAEMGTQLPNKDYTLPPEDVIVMMKSILDNRVLDENQFVRMLQDPTFIAAVTEEAKQPAPAQKAFVLPESKDKEVIRRLVQPNDPSGAEPAVHVVGSAIGQRIVHQALADMFKQSTVQNALAAALTKQWPQAQAGDLAVLAKTWLQERYDPAHETAKTLSAQGTLYKEAVKESLEFQGVKLAKAQGLPPLPAPSAPPAPRVEAPTAPAQKLAATASIAMEV